MSRWLRFAVDDTGALVVTARHPHRTASLRFTEPGLEVHAASDVSVLLDWDGARQPIRAPGDGAPVDGWRVDGTVHGRYGPYGVGIRVSGRYEPASAAVLTATYTSWRRVRMNRLWATGRVIPVVWPLLAWGWNPGLAEESTMRALVGVLTSRPELRGRLGDASRMRHLAADLSHRVLRRVAPPGAFGYRGTDVLDAVRAAGLWHPLSRPVPGDAMPTLADAVARVRATLHNGRHPIAADASDDMITDLVRKAYLDVEPWPFAALTT